MKPTPPNAFSRSEQVERKQPPPWLQQHYEEKRQRTIRLVRAAVDQLVNEEQAVTIEAICRVSVTLDPEKRGVKKSGVLNNQEAYNYYRTHSASYKAANQRHHLRRKEQEPPVTKRLLRLDPHRDLNRVRSRYLRMTKAELVERLIVVEQAYAERERQLARLQFALADMPQQATAQQQPFHDQTTESI